MPTDQELNDFYANYHSEFSQTHMAGSDFANNRYRELSKFLKQCKSEQTIDLSGSLLDVGCGTGAFIKAAKHAGWQVTGTELTPEAANLAASNSGCSVLVGDIAGLDLQEQSFEFITSYHVVEHLPDPVAKIKHCYKLLKTGGALFLETPNTASLGAKLRGAKWSHILPPEHVVYFSPRSLTHALKEGGFHTIFIRTSSPQIVESIQHWPASFKAIAKAIYNTAPVLGMGAALQAIAFKD